MNRLFVGLWVVVGCGGDDGEGEGKDGPPPEDTGTAPTDSGTTTTTLAGPGQVGSVVVEHYLPVAPGDVSYTLSVAQFADSDGGVLDMARCRILQTGCMISVDPPEYVAPSAVGARRFWEVGPFVEIDGVGLSLDPKQIDPFYVLESEEPPSGVIGWPGDELPAFEGGGIETPELTLVEPAPLTEVEIGPGDDVTIRWEGGDTLLYLNGPQPFDEFVTTGERTFTAAELAFDTPLASAYVYLSRFEAGEFPAGDHTVKTMGITRQLVWIRYADLGAYTELLPEQVGETCEAASALAPIPAGLFWADLAQYADDENLGNKNPYTGYSTAGRDLFLPIQLEAGQTLTVTFQERDDDASIYLFDAACGSVLEGADATLDGEPESFSHTATDAGVVVLALDAFLTDTGSPSTLELAIQ